MNVSPHRYFIINKPYGMESQFVSPYPGPLLGDLGFDFPKGIHAIGRLDKHSEGLLLLTTNKKVTALLFESKVPHKRTYLVQVKHVMNAESLHQLRTGVMIKLRGGGGEYTTPPCEVQIVEEPKDIFPSPRNFPAYILNTWLLMTLTEGRYRQVRKMVAAVRHRCMRLIRVSIEELSLGDLKPGEVREIPEDVFFQQLKLDKS
jgi:23S rRNA pseudouridine2457 synthase